MWVSTYREDSEMKRWQKIATITCIIGLTLYAPVELTRYIRECAWYWGLGSEYIIELAFMWGAYLFGITFMSWIIGIRGR